MGAVCIEKHFTLDRNMDGPDHPASLEPKELKEMVRSIRNIELALGDGVKQPSQSERKNIPIARKSIHIATDLPKHHTISFTDLEMKRPGDGISPMDMALVIGRKTTKKLTADTQLKFEDL